MKHATTTIAELRAGACNDELTTAINELSAAVRETGRPGTVTLKIKVSAFDGEAGEIERVEVSDQITLKKPEKKKRVSVFFLDSNNNLQRQQTIPGVEQPAVTKTSQKAG